jgi:hypothetical protein
MTDIEGLRTAMHTAVDHEQASADELIRLVMRRHRRHRRHVTLAGVAVLAAVAVAVPAVIAWHGALFASGPRPSLEHPTPRPHRLPTKMTGLPMPAGTNFRLLVSAGNGAAWYSTATRHAEPVTGLPASSVGYQFQPADRGWIATSNHNPSSPCPTDVCAGRPKPFYFIADGSPAATRIGAGYAGDGAVASSNSGAVWLATYPRATAKLTGSGYAQLVSTTGRPLGPRYRLPADYLLGSGVGTDLLLVNSNTNNLFILWDPHTGRVLRHFDNILATGPGQIAWSPGCQGCRVQILNVPAAATVTPPIPGFNPAATGCPWTNCPGSTASFSDDGRLLAVQLPGRGIEVFDTASRTLTAIPGTALSSADWQHFGWQASSHRLVIAAGPNNQPGPAQLAYWQPGATRLRITTIHNLAEISNLQTGNIG